MDPAIYNEQAVMDPSREQNEQDEDGSWDDEDTISLPVPADTLPAWCAKESPTVDMCLIVDAMFLDLLNCVSHLTTAVMCSQVFLIVWAMRYNDGVVLSSFLSCAIGYKNDCLVYY